MNILNVFLDIIYPRHCPVCDKIVKPGTLIHDECDRLVVPITGNYCLKCGRPTKKGQLEYCDDCNRRAHFFTRGRAAFEYAGVSRAIYRLKYNGRQEYAKYFGERIAKELGDEIKAWNADAIIPVPIHPNRRKKRGFNQAEVLAKALGKELDIPVNCNLVKRQIDTSPLKFMGPMERQNNLKKAFKIKGNDVELKSIIIVDDIYTTGSTIDTVARELTEHGVRSVYFVTLATGNGV